MAFSHMDRHPVMLDQQSMPYHIRATVRLDRKIMHLANTSFLKSIWTLLFGGGGGNRKESLSLCMLVFLHKSYGLFKGEVEELRSQLKRW
jgi:hypothetical protein